MFEKNNVSTGKKVSLFYRIILICIVVLLVGVLGFQLFGERKYTNEVTENENIKLQFHEDGTFKIMLLADIQDGSNVSMYTMKFIQTAIAEENPDLIILLGDNVFGFAPDLLLSKSNAEKSISTFLQPIVDAKIPFCVVFGNHDGQGALSNAEQLNYYRTFAGCMLEDEADLTGSGNYHVMISDFSGETNRLNLWFFDSGSETKINGETSYSCVAEDQIAWYLEESKKITEENGGEVIPAFVFQHIPVPEIYNLLIPVEEACEGSIEKEGRIYIKNPAITDDGFFGELPCSPIYNTGEFDAWLEAGDVMTAFFGHDHVNAFGGVYQGITMKYTPGCGFYSYGPGYNRGIQILELQEENVEEYSTRLLLYKDLVGEEIKDEKALYDGTVLRGISLFKYIQVFILLPLFFVVVIIGGIIYLVKRKKKKSTKNK